MLLKDLGMSESDVNDLVYICLGSGLATIGMTVPAVLIIGLITSVNYYDTNGNLIKNCLEKSVLLKPLATAEFLVPQKDIEGASGANFIVEWASVTKVNQPVIEAALLPH